MSCRTDFTIEVIPEPEKTFWDDLQFISGYRWENYYLFDAKWYDAEENLKTLSLNHPDLKITVYCDSEDGEKWLYHAYQGKVATCVGRVEYEENPLW